MSRSDSRFKHPAEFSSRIAFALVRAAFSIGDDIKLDTFEGEVEDIQARATIIRTPDERRVVIPNADLFTHSVIVNREGNQRRQYEITVKRVLHLNDLKRLFVEAVRRVDGVMPEPPPEAVVLHVRPNTVTLRVLWSIARTGARQSFGIARPSDLLDCQRVGTLGGNSFAPIRRLK